MFTVEDRKEDGPIPFLDTIVKPLLCKAVLASIQFAFDFFKCLLVLHFISLYVALSLHNSAHLQVPLSSLT